MLPVDPMADARSGMAMDFTGYDLSMGGKVYVHNTQDLGRGYKFFAHGAGGNSGRRRSGWYLAVTSLNRYGPLWC